ncbi:cyclomaltodextrinase N-terminal domain-containing protein [Siphonobacter sp. SORGH_AS_0500]|uniref:cyclomaltodextrinase N-terminal domain-containing protein n=1 Tax=Siphonobacter sp. SORGH_AS_0500 TaxID=1864824 RepID=UPI001E3AA56A|nr:cyclomaltodextrinase N-terminal domain-containing protein [Siphonobacter sp. SORGH_AS_0500]
MHRLAHRWIVLTCLLFCLAYFAEAQGLKVDHINPTNWFVGMKNQQLQLLMHGPNLKGTKVKVNYPGVFVERVQTVDNSNYILVDLTIAAAAKPGTVQLQCTKIFPLTEKRQNATVINGGREITITILTN